jgi:hypothetical protein
MTIPTEVVFDELLKAMCWTAHQNEDGRASAVMRLALVKRGLAHEDGTLTEEGERLALEWGLARAGSPL